MKLDAKWLFDTLEAHDTIAIYRHVYADGDAMGAQFGIKALIEARWPQKRVYAPGKSVGSCAVFYPAPDEIDEETASRSLAIILDTSNAARVDDAHWRLAAHKIRIDHHIHVESFCDEELIDPSAAATCELIGALCAEQGEQLSRECAERLYGGLISDTVNFTIGSVSERTLRVAAYLFSFGVDAVKLNMQQFGTSLRDFRYESHLRASMQMRGSLAWVIASRRDFVSYGLQFSEAKEKVFVMAGIREIAVWALFTQMNEDDAHPLYSCSLRSRTVALNDIANDFGGGGHRCACGIKNLDASQVEALISALAQRCAQGEDDEER